MLVETDLLHVPSRCWFARFYNRIARSIESGKERTGTKMSPFMSKVSQLIVSLIVHRSTWLCSSNAYLNDGAMHFCFLFQLGSVIMFMLSSEPVLAVRLLFWVRSNLSVFMQFMSVLQRRYLLLCVRLEVVISEVTSLAPAVWSSNIPLHKRRFI